MLSRSCFSCRIRGQPRQAGDDHHDEHEMIAETENSTCSPWSNEVGELGGSVAQAGCVGWEHVLGFGVPVASSSTS